MLVQRVLVPAARRESWTVPGDDGPVQPIERYLAYLTDIERSPDTVKAYAHDLKDWFVFLAGQGRDWREVRLEDVAGFVAWLRRPPAARNGVDLSELLVPGSPLGGGARRGGRSCTTSARASRGLSTCVVIACTADCSRTGRYWS